ncbi:MAG TPA: hypothetical protein VF062_19840 [Candidatus Limnocylindrales bacterium]
MRRFDFPQARRAASALAGLLAVVAVVATSSPVLAGSDKDAGSDKEIVINEELTEADELARAQEPLVAAATAFTALDPKREALGGIRLQVRKGEVELYWKGEVPGPVREEIAVQEANGVRVVVQPADYSGSELSTAINKIMEERERYPGLAVIVPLPEASGLVGYFENPEAAKEFTFPVPVGVEEAREGAVPFTRNSDTRPFWGGAAAISGGGGGCTTGFAVAQHFFVELSRGVLSAGHCDPAGGGTWFTPAGLTIGRAGARNAISDSIYIRTSSSGRTYTGGVTSNFSKQVIGPVPNFPGQFVCTEGAFTGEHCFVMNLFVGGAAIVSGGLTFGVTVGLNVTGAIAGGSGDSGGPVVVTGNPFTAHAAGLISFGIGATPCAVGTCSPLFGYIDINWVLATNFPMVLVP